MKQDNGHGDADGSYCAKCGGQGMPLSRGHLNKDSKEVKEHGDVWRKSATGKKMDSAKALRQEFAWCALGITRTPVKLELSKSEWDAERKWGPSCGGPLRPMLSSL